MNNVVETIRLIFCQGEELPEVSEVTYEFKGSSERTINEKAAVTRLMDGEFKKLSYPLSLDQPHLTVCRGVGRFLVAAAHELGGLQSLSDQELDKVFEDIQNHRGLFVPQNEKLLRYLRTDEDLTNLESDDEKAEIIRGFEQTTGLHTFRKLRAFVLTEGQSFEPQPLPREYLAQDRGACFQNSMILSSRKGLSYAEGFALSSHEMAAQLHGWCVDSKGWVIDCTWPHTGVAYYGVQFRPEYVEEKLRYFDTTPNGLKTGSLLDDPTNEWGILNRNVSDWKR